MAGKSSDEREYALLLAELHALDEDIHAARAQASQRIRGPGLQLHAHGRPEPRGERVSLRDGGQIVIRPIEPGDRDEFAAAFERLSKMSRIRRFGERVEHVTARQLTELTDVDHDSHEALIALESPSGNCVGVARFIRLPDDVTEAEFMYTVADRWQARGVGTALAERLAARARAVGVERFAAMIVVGNEPARRLLRHVAREISEHREGGKIAIVAVPRRGGP